MNNMILPIVDLVLLPNMKYTLRLCQLSKEEFYLLSDKNQEVIALPMKQAQHKGKIEADDFYKVGAVLEVINVASSERGYQVQIKVKNQVEVSGIEIFQNHIDGKVTTIAENIDMNEKNQQEMIDYIKKISHEIAAKFRDADSTMKVVDEIDNLNSLIGHISQFLPLDNEERYALMETASLKERSLMFIDYFLRTTESLQLQIEMAERFSEKANKNYREAALREQLRIIQEELKEGKADSSKKDKEYRSRIESAKMPEGIEAVAFDELEKLESQSPSSPEYNVIRNYLDLIVDLPWQLGDEKPINISEARRILNEQHYGLEKVKDRIIQHLAVMHLKKDKKGMILLLVGPPGTGKTSLGKSIANALDRKYVRLSLGGIRDEAEIRGHRRTYVGALPGKIIQELRNCGSNNPLFMIDEIDKMGSDFRGDPSSAMLEVLDPEQNFSFRDLYLDLPFDLSKVFFIATANMLEMIPPPLRDRMEVIEISGYTPMEKVKIAQKYLIARQIDATGLKEEEIQFTEGAIMKIVTGYTYEAGVRNLERNISSICRKVMVRILDGRNKKIKVDEAKVEELLGPVMIIQDVANRTPEVGMVTGLAWTPAGGDLLFIETTKMRGTGKVMVTGQLGSVMEESVEAAYSYVRSKADVLGINPEVFETVDVHIHFPEGAIPKDGPSAGVAVTVALISLFTGLPVFPDLAMTGEVTLKGRVLPIGGLKEKSLAAFRGGIKRVAFPEANIKDLVEIPKEVKAGLEFIPIKTVDDVLQHALGHIIVPSSDVIDEIQHLTDGKTG
jgi:ATP-dependent Lon protease